MCIWILFLYFLTSVYVPNRSMPRLRHFCTETFSQIRTSLHYRAQLESLVWDQLKIGTFQGVTSAVVVHNAQTSSRKPLGQSKLNLYDRSRHTVRTDPKMIVTLRREWRRLPQMTSEPFYWFDSSPVRCLYAD